MTEDQVGYMDRVLKELLFTSEGHTRKLQALLHSCDFTAKLVSIAYALMKLGKVFGH